MKKIVATSIVTATLLLVGCGGGGSSSSSDSNNNGSTALTDTRASTIPTRVTGKGYYVDSAVEGVEYECGEKHGVTDENGTFEFDTDTGCKFRLGELKLRELNITALDDNVTVLEDNITVAQLLQTLDADGNASNGIQLLDGVDEVVNETITSPEDLEEDANATDLLEALHSALKEKYPDEYNGTIVDKNETIIHLQETKKRLEEEHRRTQHDVIKERELQLNLDDNNMSMRGARSGHGDANMSNNGIGDGHIENGDGNMSRRGIENGHGEANMSDNAMGGAHINSDENNMSASSNGDNSNSSASINGSSQGNMNANHSSQSVNTNISTGNQNIEHGSKNQAHLGF
jgi:hypothetical protein